MKDTAHESDKGVRWVKADAHGAGAVNGTGVDKTGFGEALFVVSLDDMGAAGTAVFKVQDSADNSTFADITGATTGVKAAAGLFVGRVDLEKVRKFVRGVLTIGVNAVDAGVLGSMHSNKVMPVTQTVATEFNV